MKLFTIAFLSRAMITFLFYSTPSFADIEDCGRLGIVSISNYTFPSGHNVTCKASQELKLGPTVIVESNATVLLVSPSITISSDVKVERHSVFSVQSTPAMPVEKPVKSVFDGVRFDEVMLE